MQHQRTLTPAEQDGMIDSAVLGLLLSRNDQRLWSKDEIERTVGEPGEVTDSLNRLYGGGLIHRLDRFVWASRAAVMSQEIGI
jgi:hypothetical protein